MTEDPWAAFDEASVASRKAPNGTSIRSPACPVRPVLDRGPPEPGRLPPVADAGSHRADAADRPGVGHRRHLLRRRRVPIPAVAPAHPSAETAPRPRRARPTLGRDRAPAVSWQNHLSLRPLPVFTAQLLQFEDQLSTGAADPEHPLTDRFVELPPAGYLPRPLDIGEQNSLEGWLDASFGFAVQLQVDASSRMSRSAP